jgi:flagellar P-ring protein precursor FlgI
VGRVVGGATIEKEIAYNFDQKKSLTLVLSHPDFTTATRVAEAINTEFFERLARTKDAATILIDIPEKYAKHIVQLVTRIETLNVTPDIPAKVVINERTGTVVMGENVRVSTVAIAHGNLSIEIKESSDVSQPMPFSKGETVTTPDTDISIQEEKSKLYLMESGVSIGEVVKALNALGVSPRDLITIFQAIKAAGALQSKLEIM